MYVCLYVYVLFAHVIKYVRTQNKNVACLGRLLMYSAQLLGTMTAQGAVNEMIDVSVMVAAASSCYQDVHFTIIDCSVTECFL